MSSKIDFSPSQFSSGGLSGLLGSPALGAAKIIGGAMTGNPAMMAGGMAKKGSPIGAALGGYQTGQGVADAFSGLGNGVDPSSAYDTDSSSRDYSPQNELPAYDLNTIIRRKNSMGVV